MRLCKKIDVFLYKSKQKKQKSKRAKECIDFYNEGRGMEGRGGEVMGSISSQLMTNASIVLT